MTEKRIARIECRADGDEEGVLEGMPIVFGQATVIEDYGGKYQETIDPSALNEADLGDVGLFINHEIDSIPLARCKDGKGNMQFRVDPDGVRFTAKLDIVNNQEARALYSAVKRGILDSMSFMFTVTDDEWDALDTDLPTRVIKSIGTVYEFSIVNRPAYPQTSVMARSKEAGEEESPLVQARKRYDEANELALAKAKNRNLLLRRKVA